MQVILSLYQSPLKWKLEYIVFYYKILNLLLPMIHRLINNAFSFPITNYFKKKNHITNQKLYNPILFSTLN